MFHPMFASDPPAYPRKLRAGRPLSVPISINSEDGGMNLSGRNVFHAAALRALSCRFSNVCRRIPSRLPESAFRAIKAADVAIIRKIEGAETAFGVQGQRA